MPPSRSGLCTWIFSSGFVLLSGRIVAAVGILVLVGWYAGLEGLTRIAPGLAMMKPNTAACFILAGTALALVRFPEDRSRRGQIALSCTSALLLVAALTLAEYAFGWNPGFDHWLYQVPDVSGVQHPSRMTLGAATNFLLVGLALIAVRFERPWLSQGLALLVGLLSLFALTVYVYGVQELYKLRWFSSMALHTALSFALLAIGLLCARADQAWTAVVSREGPGGKMARRLLITAVFVPLLVGWMCLQNQRAGWHGSELGLALFALSCVTILTVIIWQTARALQITHDKLSHRERLYNVLSQCNQAIVRISNRDRLFTEVCRIAVEYGQFRMAWIAVPDPANETVRPAAFAGVEKGFFDPIHISLRDEPAGHVPSAIAIRERRYVISQDVRRDQQVGVLRKMALPADCRSVAAFPLYNHDAVIGAFVLSSVEAGFFDSDEVRLLQEVAGDISFALEKLEGDKERRLFEDEMGRLGQELQTILDSVPAMIFYKDRAHRLVRANAAMVRALGKAPHELFGKTDTELGTPYAEQYAKDEDEIVTTGRPKLGFIEPLATPSGIRWLQTDKVPIRATNGEITGFIGLAVDITERRWAEEALRASEADFRASFCSSAIGQVQADAETGQYLRVNSRFCEITGYTEQELLGMTFYDLTHPDDRETDSFAHDQMVSGEVAELSREKRYVRKDGEAVWVSINASLIRDAAGQPLRTLAVVQDITERMRLEDQLRQSQKMQAIGQLAGGIAHDFNNLLTAISGNTRLGLEDLPEGHPVREFLGEIHIATSRATDLVRRILTFSRGENPTLKPLVLSPVVEEALKLLRATLPASIEIRQSLSPDLPTVLADPTQIHQIVMNLGTNASHAMKERGLLEVTLSVIEVDATLARRSAELREGRYVRLAVSDSGCGMDSITLSRIFEPFFTTKPQGQGTGLGLSVVHGIMKGHQGAITAYSQLGKGTVFHLYFPAQTSAAVSEITFIPPAQRGSGERILFVDDEHLLVHLAVEMLSRLGYEVAGFTRPEDALRAFRDGPDLFDLVISDLSMPGMTGPEFARALLETRPNLPVIIATGYIREEDRQSVRGIGIRELLLKPNTVEDFGPVIHRLIAENARR